MTFKEMRKQVKAEGRRAAKEVENLLRESYPNGQISENDVRAVLSPVLRRLHKTVTEITAEAINQMNDAAGVGMRAVNPEYDIARENDLVAEISRRSFEDGFTW